MTFNPDGHRSVFRRDWLAAQALAAQGGAVADPRTGAVARYGCDLLRGVPVSPGMVLEVAATFGYVRETNYGRLFDVRVEPNPTLQLRQHAGDTGLVDGFAAAAADPESFGVLTGTPVPFGYIDKETELTARQPLISLSPRGAVLWRRQ